MRKQRSKWGWHSTRRGSNNGPSVTAFPENKRNGRRVVIRSAEFSISKKKQIYTTGYLLERKYATGYVL